jgi:hypothetical protein
VGPLDVRQPGSTVRGPAAKVARGQTPAGGQRGDRGSVGWFILSSVITNAIITVSLARLVSGKPVPGRKVLVTVVAFAILFSGLWAFVGWVLNDAT